MCDFKQICQSSAPPFLGGAVFEVVCSGALCQVGDGSRSRRYVNRRDRVIHQQDWRDLPAASWGRVFKGCLQARPSVSPKRRKTSYSIDLAINSITAPAFDSWARVEVPRKIAAKLPVEARRPFSRIQRWRRSPSFSEVLGILHIGS